MTLALLEDSGWYKAYYSMADQLDWGRNQGTEFVTSPCNVWKGAYHCNTTQFSGCTYNRERGRGLLPNSNLQRRSSSVGSFSQIAMRLLHEILELCHGTSRALPWDFLGFAVGLLGQCRGVLGHCRKAKQ
ncbi:hypothetical protein VNO80_11019 [Phaseolus coccineus]|uniref:Leishmanolysin-like peptidase n=1 Tax=Phaseolus coccineus TaxID=3886 RepID=A0AAN9N9R4_PHACN